MLTSPVPLLPDHYKLPSGEPVVLRALTAADAPALTDYLENLLPASKRRFGPHSFAPEAVRGICRQAGRDDVLRLVATLPNDSPLLAYVLLLNGVRESDRVRYRGYGEALDGLTDVTLAPSVADAYQGRGLGKVLMEKVIAISRHLGKARIVLWGGVQATNLRAVAYYRKAGFEPCGQFEDRNGLNYDMLMPL